MHIRSAILQQGQCWSLLPSSQLLVKSKCEQLVDNDWAILGLLIGYNVAG